MRPTKEHPGWQLERTHPYSGPALTRTLQTQERTAQIAPSQANMPSVQQPIPEYPFQHICADFFNHIGKTYMVIVDRYSHWPIVERSLNGAKGLIDILRKVFSTYGIPDSLSSDGGPEFTSNKTSTFLNSWGVSHRRSSAYNPHSNCRAKLGVKTVKRLISGNTGNTGDLDRDTFQQAILSYRNTPDPTTKESPTMCVFGRPTRDLLPLTGYSPHHSWSTTLDLRERSLAKRASSGKMTWD